MQKQCFAISGTRAPADANHDPPDHRLHNDQISLGGQGRGACQLSLGLHRQSTLGAGYCEKYIRTSASFNIFLPSFVMCLHFSQ